MTFPLELTFFGLTLETAPIVRINLFTQIHEICFHGQGGYDWNTIYNMPIWLRKFTFQQIQDYNNKKNEDIKAANKGGNKTSLVDSAGNVNKQQFSSLNQTYKSTPGNKSKKK